MNKIAIVGAGVTGLSAARSLTAAGYAVTLFDKGRRPGGRMASREGAAGSFDHGVQYLRATAAEADEIGAGQLLPWPAIAPRDGSGGWLAAPTFNHLARHWANGLDVRCSHTVSTLQPGATGRGWQLRFAETAGAADAPLAWIAREDLKPGRSGPPRLTVQAGARWSTTHLELPAETAALELQALAARQLGIGSSSLAATTHRWRYAFVSQPLGEPVLTLGRDLHYASDAGLGSRVTLAWQAGRAAAARIAAR